MKTLFTLGIWYGIFCFITETPNPMDWSTTAKVWAVILGLIIVSNTKD